MFRPLDERVIVVMRKLFVSRLGLARSEGEQRGAAIVAAIGVTLICISLGALVISQAVLSQRDSGRNRARTVEIHAAEAGVDSLYERLQKGDFVCRWETTEADALGPDAVGAQAEIEYWDGAGNAMDCSGADLNYDADNLPVRARVLVTSDAEPTLAGIEPERSFESEVLLSEVRDPNHSAAIFSGGGFTAPNGGAARGTGADVWVNDGDYNCNASESFEIEGNLYAVNGAASFNHDCAVHESAFVSDRITMNNSSRIEGDAYVKNQGLTFGNTTASIHGDAMIKGSAGGGGYSEGNSVRGRLSTGTEPSPFPQKRGFPSVKYLPNDWLNADSDSWSFDQVFPPSQWRAYLRDNALANGAPDWSEFVTQTGCPMFDRANWSFGGDLSLPDVGTVIDWRPCTFSANNLNINVYADTVIFAKGFELNNAIRFRSGDGKPHALWLIVPDESLGQCKWFGSTTTHFDSPLETFAYAPCQVNMNMGSLNGQIYGDPVRIDVQMDLQYVPLGIPGVDLMPGFVNPAGNWDVDVIHKRETGDRVS